MDGEGLAELAFSVEARIHLFTSALFLCFDLNLVACVSQVKTEVHVQWAWTEVLMRWV